MRFIISVDVICTMYMVQHFIHVSTTILDWKLCSLYSETDYQATLAEHKIQYDQNMTEIPYIPRILPVPMFKVQILGLSSINPPRDWSKFHSSQ